MEKHLENYVIYSNGMIYSHFIKDYLKPDITRDGYAQVTLTIDGERVRYRVHRLIAGAFIPNPEGKATVNHKDGNKLNNDYTNLEWATHYENNKHARETGLNPIAESNSKRWENDEFRVKTSRAISEARIQSGCAKGKKNPSFRYLILHNGEEISKEELREITNYAESTTNTKIREYAQGKPCKRFIENNIHIIDTKKDVQTNERVD